VIDLIFSDLHMTALKVTESISIPDRELILHYIRSGGPGGQNVNKVATGAHLRFDFRNSPTLPLRYKECLEALSDSRIGKNGVITIKANRHRTQEMNRNDALSRLAQLIRKAVIPRKSRRPTRPTTASRELRLDVKKKRGQAKKMRKGPTSADF
jgi:ribosome-associated protein